MLNIEQERREFQSWAEEERKRTGGIPFSPWEVWLAAKRSTMGAEPVALKDAPKQIYLVIEDAGGDLPFATFREAEKAARADVGMMWCVDRQGLSDIPYVRADLVATPSTDAKDAAKEITEVGTRMSNMMFNFAQHGGLALSAEACANMKDLQMRWDAAIAARKLTP